MRYYDGAGMSEEQLLELKLIRFGSLNYVLTERQGDTGGEQDGPRPRLGGGGAVRYSGEMLCSSVGTAKGLLVYYCRSQFYFVAVREQAWLLIDRLRDVVHGGNGAGIRSAGTAAENAGSAQDERVGSGVWTELIQCELLVRGRAAEWPVRLPGSREQLSSGEVP
jgi:hypothetical protein